MLLEVSFDELEGWSLPKIRKYQYEFVSDSDIEEALLSNELERVDLQKDWDKESGSSSTKSDNPYHILRVAKIVKCINEGVEFEPVVINIKNYNECGYCVSDGQHRLRAMKYLKMKNFKASFPWGTENLSGKPLTQNAL